VGGQKGFCEVRWQRRRNVDRRARHWMSEGEAGRVQELPFEPEVSRDAIDRVSGDRKFDRSEVDADLMRPPRLEPDTEERVAGQELLDLEMRHGRAGCVRNERVAKPVVPVTAYRRVDRPPARARPAGDERQVLPCQRSAADEPLQPLVRLLRARDDEQAGRVPVEAMDDARPVLLPARRTRRGESLGERAASVTGCGMDDHAGWLVDDEEVVVRVGDRQIRIRNGRLRDRGRRRLDLDLLPAREPVALAAGSPVHEDGPSFEQPLGRGARSHFRQPSEVAIEPLAGGLRRNDEPLQRLGSRSAQTSAPSRIPTPITMKLSARLKAGQ
jgi:hypothetical protein